MTTPTITIRPNPGKQERFLQSVADIAVYGGAAGGGKTWGLLMEPIYHLHVDGFSSIIFRRTSVQVRNPGGLWDTANEIYPHLGGESNETRLEWEFPSGTIVRFGHLEHEKDVHNFQGAQIPLICWDELTHFSERQFFYLLSRNRSLCGVKPYMRATCNPDADSWVAKFISWWIDQETGYPITEDYWSLLSEEYKGVERAGVLRWFVRLDNKLHWANDPDEFYDLFPTMKPRDIQPKSVTFIPARLDDNRPLTEKDPGYRANLLAQDIVERERLLGGNWKIRPAAGMVFPRSGWRFCEAPPSRLKLCRYWDKAGTEGGEGARTAGVLVGVDPGPTQSRQFYVLDAVVGRWEELKRARTIKATAEQDRARYGNVSIWLEQEPGSGGKESARMSVRDLAGFDVHIERVTGEKQTRWKPFSAQVQAGNVWIVQGAWDWTEYIDELDHLSGDKELDKKKLMDLADASSGAFNKLIMFKKPELTYMIPDEDSGKPLVGAGEPSPWRSSYD